MTIYTIVYNNYGQFLDKWLECVRKNEPDEIIVILGNNHGVLKKYDDIIYIESDSNIMGTLRNEALKIAKSDWVLYFSVDDELMENAKHEILRHNDHDAVALRFYNKTVNRNTPMKSAIITNPRIWMKTSVPGYIAHKRIINGKQMLYKDTEIPNYPFLFELWENNARICLTDTEVAYYVRRRNSHGDLCFKNSRWLQFQKQINQWADESIQRK